MKEMNQKSSSDQRNNGILTYLHSFHPEMIDDLIYMEMTDPSVINSEGLGTNPDNIKRLWITIAAKLPCDCRAVVYKTPVLAHPQSGVIFGWTSGSPSYALRLPEKERLEAINLGAKTMWTYNDAWMKNLGREHNTVLDLATIGPEWVFGWWLPEEVNWCLVAYNFAS